jgi:hypothetical protein
VTKKKHQPSGKKYHHHKECTIVAKIMNWIGSEERRDLPGNELWLAEKYHEGYRSTRS